MADDLPITDAVAKIDALIREMRAAGHDLTAHLLEMAKLELTEAAQARQDAPRA